jgi:hypothetical protein
MARGHIAAPPTITSIRVMNVGMCTCIDCACAMKTVFFPRDFGRHKRAIQGSEVTMKKEIFQENKARWEVFEWIGSTQSKVIWAVGAAIVVLGIVYLVW